jgi:hypothetical protein
MFVGLNGVLTPIFLLGIFVALHYSSNPSFSAHEHRRKRHDHGSRATTTPGHFGLLKAT